MTAKRFHLQVVEVPVRNVKESVEWYTGMFGVGFCFPYHEGDEEAWLNVNGIGFGLIQTNEIPKMEFISAKGERKIFFSFQVDNIQELYENMKQKGATVKEMVYKQSGGHSFQFVDPDGNCMGIWGGWPKDEQEIERWVGITGSYHYIPVSDVVRSGDWTKGMLASEMSHYGGKAFN